MRGGPLEARVSAEVPARLPDLPCAQARRTQAARETGTGRPDPGDAAEAIAILCILRPTRDR